MLTELIDKAAETGSTFVFDPSQIKKDGEAAIKEQKKSLAQLKSNKAGF